MNILAKGESQYIAPEKQKPLGKQILDPGAATPLALAVAFVGIVVVCSVFARDWVAGAIPSIRQVPAFSYSLVFGLLVQLLAQKFDLDKYIDRGAFTLIQGFAMDILIVAAIASIFFGLVAGYALPLLAIASPKTPWPASAILLTCSFQSGPLTTVFTTLYSKKYS